MNDLNENKDLNNGNDYLFDEYEDNYSEYSDDFNYDDDDNNDVNNYTDNDFDIIKKENKNNIIVYCKSGRIFNPYFPNWPSIYEARNKIEHIDSYDNMISYLKSLFDVIIIDNKFYFKRLLVLMATECFLKLKRTAPDQRYNYIMVDSHPGSDLTHRHLFIKTNIFPTKDKKIRPLFFIAT
jgi:hypothetical protein